MTIAISNNYRRLEPEEVPILAAELETAWQSPEIPMRQWISVVRAEVERFRDGESMPHFEILLRALKSIPLDNPSLLDVGASSAFYSRILSLGGYLCRYEALDYSEEYRKVARDLYPDVTFHVADARTLPFKDSAFEIVLSGCVMLHVMEYEKVISESARVASDYVIFNRTPIVVGRETEAYSKEAYAIPCLEWRFSESELLDLFAKYGLSLVSSEDIFFNEEEQYGHRTYLLKKVSVA